MQMIRYTWIEYIQKDILRVIIMLFYESFSIKLIYKQNESKKLICLFTQFGNQKE